MNDVPEINVGSSRRRFLQASVLLGGGMLAAACGGAPAASPTTAPKAAAEATKPAATAAPAGATTPAATKPAAEATKPAATTTTPAPTPAAAVAPAAKPKEVPRNRTLIYVFGGTEGKWKDFDLWNPYNLGASHQFGPNLLYEPLAYYSAFADKMHHWLAESHQYSQDFKQLTIKTRSGITWSDGKPFSAEDVAYTFSTLKDLGSKVRWGVNVSQFVESAAATDANTVVIKFKVPAPRFFFFAAYKFDIGIYMVPKHIYQGKDWAEFKHFDVAQGMPVTTSPWQVVFSTPDQKIIDRRSDWWAVKAGLVKEIPKVERLVHLPVAGETQMATSLISNQIDFALLIVPTFKTVLAQNPQITTFTSRDKPYGYVDWWPLSVYVNNEREPFNDKDVRWALSYMLDRKQVVDIAYEGASSPSKLPMPTYPPLLPYFDAVKDLLEKYDTTKFDAARATEILTGKGWKKEGTAWRDAKGQPVKMEIMGFSFLSAVGPVVAEQFRRQGIDATYTMPPNTFDRFQKGDYSAVMFGHGGSVSDPYETLSLYQSASLAVPGQHQVNFPRWKNEAYDKVVDEVYKTPMEDKQKLQQLFRQAMEIWLPELPDIQLVEFYHNIARNETYWKGWPTKENAYVNEASWHLTWQLVLNNLVPAQ